MEHFPIAKPLAFVYNNNNRTSRTSPRKRVTCPREGILLYGEERNMLPLKKPTTYQEQLDILRKRNVTIDDVPRCTAILESVNYYRFTAYFLPFKQPDGMYRDGTNFYQVYRIYEFDRKLRNIIFSAIEEVEIYLRARFAYFHAHKYGAEGYMDPANFSSRHQVERFQDNLNREISNNKRSSFVAHHKKYYDGHFPIWVVVELFTFGMLSRFYGDMETADQKSLSRKLYNTTPKNVISWLRCCTDLRNICAHYGRLYYRIFPATPAGFRVSAPQINKLWGAVLALRELYPDATKWNSEILPKLDALFEEYAADIALEHIGFPEDWCEQLKKVKVELLPFDVSKLDTKED